LEWACGEKLANMISPHCAPDTYERQSAQLAFYRSIHMRHLSRARNSILKRLPWQDTEWISQPVLI